MQRLQDCSRPLTTQVTRTATNCAACVIGIMFSSSLLLGHQLLATAEKVFGPPVPALLHSTLLCGKIHMHQAIANDVAFSPACDGCISQSRLPPASNKKHKTLDGMLPSPGWLYMCVCVPVLQQGVVQLIADDINAAAANRRPEQVSAAVTHTIIHLSLTAGATGMTSCKVVRLHISTYHSKLSHRLQANTTGTLRPFSVMALQASWRYWL